ncbi:MAG: arginase family protein [Salinivirgaceae bacterium]|nr:arginase family protein [Salinivirgaceae bacterium]
MEELKGYFDSINADSFNRNLCNEGFIGKSLGLDWELQKSPKPTVAIIGLTETRNAFPQKYSVNLDAVRSYLYQLAGFNKLMMVDMGNLKMGETIKDTYASLSFVTNYLLNQQIIPIYIGGTQDNTLPIFQGIEQALGEAELTLIDSRIDHVEDDFHAASYLGSLLKLGKKSILSSVIGYQSYFVSNQQLRFLADQLVETVRLGAVRSSMNQIEPVFRDADMVSFDVSAIRQPDCPATSFPSPNGFYNEEACQLAYLAGLSDKMKVFALFEYQSEKDGSGQSAHTIAQLIWHFISGITHRKGDFPVKDTSSYKKIFVKFDRIDTDLVFYQNSSNHRFWVEIPVGKTDEKRIIACSERDYLDICNNEIPERIWINIQRYL